MASFIDDIRERFAWREVALPRPWFPTEVGQELVGFYGGKTLRQGQYGQYEVVLVHVPLDGSYLLSGTRLIQLMDASMVGIGHPVRIIWQGVKETAQGHKMKLFDVLVAEGDAIPADALPEVRPH